MCVMIDGLLGVCKMMWFCCELYKVIKLKNSFIAKTASYLDNLNRYAIILCKHWSRATKTGILSEEQISV